MRHIESELQQNCIKWFRCQYPKLTLIHIPNGGYRNPIEAKRLKAEGVKAGVADLLLAKMNINRCLGGMFIELKSPKGRQTQSQKNFEASVIKDGYRYVICRSFDEFMNLVNEYLK